MRCSLQTRATVLGFGPDTLSCPDQGSKSERIAQVGTGLRGRTSPREHQWVIYETGWRHHVDMRSGQTNLWCRGSFRLRMKHMTLSHPSSFSSSASSFIWTVEKCTGWDRETDRLWILGRRRIVVGSDGEESQLGWEIQVEFLVFCWFNRLILWIYMKPPCLRQMSDRHLGICRIIWWFASYSGDRGYLSGFGRFVIWWRSNNYWMGEWLWSCDDSRVSGNNYMRWCRSFGFLT